MSLLVGAACFEGTSQHPEHVVLVARVCQGGILFDGNVFFLSIVAIHSVTSAACRTVPVEDLFFHIRAGIGHRVRYIQSR